MDNGDALGDALKNKKQGLVVKISVHPEDGMGNEMDQDVVGPGELAAPMAHADEAQDKELIKQELAKSSFPMAKKMLKKK